MMISHYVFITRQYVEKFKYLKNLLNIVGTNLKLMKEKKSTFS